MAKYLKLGEKSSFFHDPYSGVTIAKGEVVEVSTSKTFGKKIQSAISSGHIVYTDAPKAADKEFDTEALKKKFLDVVVKNTKEEIPDIEAIGKKFKLEELKALALVSDIELEESDGKAEIIEALLS